MASDSEKGTDIEGAFIILPPGEIILFTAYQSHKAKRSNFFSLVLEGIYSLWDAVMILTFIAALGIAYTFGNILIVVAVLLLIIILKIFFRLTSSYLKKDCIESFGALLNIDRYRPKRYIFTTARILKTSLWVDNNRGERLVKCLQISYEEIKDVQISRAPDYPDGVGDVFIESNVEAYKVITLEYVEDAQSLSTFILKKSKEQKRDNNSRSSITPLDAYNGWADRKNILEILFPGDVVTPLYISFLKKKWFMAGALLLFLAAEALKDYDPNTSSVLLVVSGTVIIAVLVEDTKPETVLTNKRVFRTDRQRRIIENLPYDMMRGVNKTGKKGLAIDVKGSEKTQFKIEDLHDTDKAVEYIKNKIAQ